MKLNLNIQTKMIPLGISIFNSEDLWVFKWGTEILLETWEEMGISLGVWTIDKLSHEQNHLLGCFFRSTHFL
jgi:hypothetical protein